MSRAEQLRQRITVLRRDRDRKQRAGALSKPGTTVQTPAGKYVKLPGRQEWVAVRTTPNAVHYPRRGRAPTEREVRELTAIALGTIKGMEHLVRRLLIVLAKAQRYDILTS